MPIPLTGEGRELARLLYEIRWAEAAVSSQRERA
jgi:hypothetical protein